MIQTHFHGGEKSFCACFLLSWKQCIFMAILYSHNLFLWQCKFTFRPCLDVHVFMSIHMCRTLIHFNTCGLKWIHMHASKQSLMWVLTLTNYFVTTCLIKIRMFANIIYKVVSQCLLIYCKFCSIVSEFQLITLFSFHEHTNFGEDPNIWATLLIWLVIPNVHVTILKAGIDVWQESSVKLSLVLYTYYSIKFRIPSEIVDI